MTDKEYIAILERRCEHLKNVLYDMHDVDTDMVVSYIRRGMLTANDALFLLSLPELDEIAPDQTEIDILSKRHKELSKHMRNCIRQGVPIPTSISNEWAETCNRLGELRETYNLSHTE